jgi:CO/xanthine dehydrogenase Mo-binding subunit
MAVTVAPTSLRTFTMDIATIERRGANNSGAHGFCACTSDVEPARNGAAEHLDIEATASSPWLPADRKWAVRFGAGATVTIVLGMRNYGRGCFSAFFASLVADRLGIPYRRIRLYYSGTLPAVLQGPLPPRTAPCWSNVGPIAAAAADVIAGMCDQVIERGRVAFAAMSRVETDEVGFDRPSGRFFVLDRGRSRSILEIAGQVRRGRRVSVTLSTGLRYARER